MSGELGFVTIRPGAYYSFAEYGTDGCVHVTIKIGSNIRNANVRVANNYNVIVDQGGYIKNAVWGKMWNDIEGVDHAKKW